MKHGSLFSGIGGFDLAAEWIGWENVFHCEWNPFGQKILKYYWPKAKSYEDITQTDFTIHRGNIDILTGGFPCQPYSTAGKRLGKEDDRHLWPEMLRAIREIQPRYIVGENVSGLINWNGGMVFDEVQAEMEAEGYEVTPFILPACAVNAPHRRDRVWFIAYSSNSRVKGLQSKWEDRVSKFGASSYSESERTGRIQEQSKTEGTQNSDELSRVKLRVPLDEQLATNSNSIGLRGKTNRHREAGLIDKASKIDDWEDFPAQSPVCDRDDGFSSELDSITFREWYQESIKGAGNAIVPQVAFQIFNAIEEFETINNH